MMNNPFKDLVEHVSHVVESVAEVAEEVVEHPVEAVIDIVEVVPIPFVPNDFPSATRGEGYCGLISEQLSSRR